MSKISSPELSGALWVASGFELILRMTEDSRFESSKFKVWEIGKLENMEI